MIMKIRLVPLRLLMRFCYGATSGAMWWRVSPPVLECFWSLTCQALLTTNGTSFLDGNHYIANFALHTAVPAG
jgi:hypothetical protein